MNLEANKVIVTDGIVVRRESLNQSMYMLDISLQKEGLSYQAGNFVMLALENRLVPFLPRPFSIFDFENNLLKIVFKVVGKGTELLANMQMPYKVKLWGPLGNAFPISNQKNVVVAGGLGLVPLYQLTKHFNFQKIFVGFRNRDEAFFLDELQNNPAVTISTDDGSLGNKGFITEYFENFLSSLSDRDITVYACGPHAFLKKIWDLSRIYEIDNIYASFETVMACGFGVCLGCAVETPFGYVKICKKGPVFKVQEIFG